MGRIGGWLSAVVLVAAIGVCAWAEDELRCPQCGRGYPAGARFCLDDGSRLAPRAETCPKCGIVRAGSARFCGSCGYDFTPKSVNPPAEKPPAGAPRERICPKCNRKALPGTKFCAGCGGPLPAQEAPVAGGGGSSGGSGVDAAAGERMWVSSIVAVSSQGGAKTFSAGQLVGPPDVERPAKDGKAWCPSLARRGIEWVIVRFPRRAVPRAIRIHESSAQGFVVRLDVVIDGREVLWWEAEDRANPRQNILECMSTEDVGAIDTLKITIDTKKVRAWTEIDAVELIAAAPKGTGGRRDVPRRDDGATPGDDGGARRDDTPPAREGLPTTGGGFASPDDCFDAWKRAILDYDSSALAACYIASERRAIEQEPDVAQAIFSRYGEAMRRDDWSIASRTNEAGEPVWVLDVRVKEATWTHRAKEKLRFRKESGSWRLQIERGQ